jgi:hypothetical protein
MRPNGHLIHQKLAQASRLPVRYGAPNDPDGSRERSKAAFAASVHTNIRAEDDFKINRHLDDTLDRRRTGEAVIGQRICARFHFWNRHLIARPDWPSNLPLTEDKIKHLDPLGLVYILASAADWQDTTRTSVDKWLTALGQVQQLLVCAKCISLAYSSCSTRCRYHSFCGAPQCFPLGIRASTIVRFDYCAPRPNIYRR